MRSRLGQVCAAMCGGLAACAASADGTEALGPSSAAIPSGTGFVAAGTGMVTQPGVINLNVPGGATVEAAYLYWSVFATNPTPADDTVSVNGNPVTGTLIGGPTTFFFSERVSVFRADISSMVAPGANVLTITDLTTTDAQFPDAGAGVLAIINDGSPLADLSVYDGSDLAFFQFAPPLRDTVPVTHTFPADAVERTGNLILFAASVEPDRPNSVQITIDGATTEIFNVFTSGDGAEWDTVNLAVTVPAGATAMTVQCFSKSDGSGRQPASLNWTTSAFSIVQTPDDPNDPNEPNEPPGGEGCTPGYWRQPHHFDDWTAPYTPDTLFSDVFEDAFPGQTLVQVVAQGGGGLNALGRHTVAALLNAASADVSYDLTTQEVIDMFNAVFPGSRDDYNALKDDLEFFNEQGCPLGNELLIAPATSDVSDLGGAKLGPGRATGDSVSDAAPLSCGAGLLPGMLAAGFGLIGLRRS